MDDATEPRRRAAPGQRIFFFLTGSAFATQNPFLEPFDRLAGVIIFVVRASDTCNNRCVYDCFWRQGDQIGPICAYWVIVYFGQLFKIAEALMFGLLFSNVKVMHIFLQNMC
jgi:hypothetical protein